MQNLQSLQNSRNLGAPSQRKTFTLPISANNSINFSNGTSMYGKILNYAALDSLTNFTMEYWYYSNGTNTNKSTFYLRTDATHYFRGATDGSGSETCNCGVHYSGQETFYGRTSGWGINGSWQHLAFVNTASTKILQGFRDGVSLGGNFTQAGTGTQDLIVGADFYFGTDYALGSFIKGRHACLRMWSTARTGAQLLANKDLYLDPSQETGLIMNVNLNEGTGSTAANTVTNSNNMSLLNSPAWAAGPTLTVKSY